MTDNLESRLHPDHLTDLRKSGLSDETILEAGIKSATPGDIDKIFGYPTYAKSAYEIPYPETDYSRYRMFYDDANKINSLGEERPKYRAKKDSGNCLYIPVKARPILNDLSIPLYITEGEKKALKACQEGLCCIAISGLWNWKVKDRDELISDFDLITLDGRTVYIVPDSRFREPDRHGKQKNLWQAVYELAYRLIDKGAKVFWVELPKGDVEVKLDDYLCNHSACDFKKLPVHQIRKLTILEEIEGANLETPPYEITRILKRIAEEVSSETEKDVYLRQIKERTKTTKTSMRADIREYDGTEKKKSQADMLIEIASQHTLFHDDTKEGYAYVDGVVMKIRSGSYKCLLSKELWDEEGIAPNSDALNQALNVIDATAVYNDKLAKLNNRIAEHGGSFYYDLCDTPNVVQITPNGWEVTFDYPILFKRYSHQQKQVIPKKGGDIQKLFNFINVKDEQHRLLILVYLISCFIPNIPHPIFHPWGDQGAGKTSMFEFFKELVDPSRVGVFITPRNPEELVQALSHHYLCLLDNLSSFPDWLSDLLSQACTGGGFSKRMLYTDDDDVIYTLLRCIGINGINLLVSRADMMDRTILLHMDRIEPSMRKEKKVIMQEFAEEKPYILGGIFETLSKAMSIYPTVKLSNLPRMADFVTWGVSIAKALGYQADGFIDAYQKNIEAQNSEIINSNTLAQAVLVFMQDREHWDGTVRQVYEDLGKLVTVSKDDRTFPKHFNKLRSHLNRIKANLSAYGIRFKIEDFSNHNKGVPISFQKVAKRCSVSSVSSVPSKDGGFRTEHPTEHPKVSSVVSSVSEPSKIKPTEHTEHTEDKKQPFWKEEKIKNEEIPEIEFIEEVKTNV